LTISVLRPFLNDNDPVQMTRARIRRIHKIKAISPKFSLELAEDVELELRFIVKDEVGG
jgi:hypothetical protein